MILKAGKYYVGDPCYIFDKSWDSILNRCGYFVTTGNAGFDFLGYKFMAGSTAYGDGTYKDNQGNSYGVDAGLLSVMPVRMLLIDNVRTEAEIRDDDIMHIFEMAQDFEATMVHGVLRFGPYVIDTANEKEEEWDEDEDEIVDLEDGDIEDEL